jgi:SAM-dependent methyltransferase
MSGSNAAQRYFEWVYPVLRGIRGIPPVRAWTRAWTEPGQSERLAWVLSEVGSERPLEILDAGCGEGLYAVRLAEMGHRVTAIDFSHAMIEAARARCASSATAGRLRLVHADLRSWSASQDFDVVLCLGVADYYDDAPDWLARLFGFARDRMLVSLTKAAAGPRLIARRGWLRMNGVPFRSYRREDLPRVLDRFPEQGVEVLDTRWTHCITIRRRVPANGNGRPEQPAIDARR